MSRPDRDLSEDVAFFLTASAILEAAETRHRRVDAGRRALADPLEDEDESEAQEASRIEIVSDDVIEAAFREQGEAGMADLYRDERREFWSRFERGREGLMRPRPAEDRPRGED